MEIDRILDAGIIVEGWMRISLAGLDLVSVRTRVVISSIERYLELADKLGRTRQI